MDFSLELSKIVADRGSYFDATPGLDSSTSASPDNTYRFGNNIGGIPADQAWNPVDLEVFTTFDDLEQAPTKGINSVSPSENSEEPLPASKVRRRAQNRASQRAFRERKEKHVKGLECQLELLNEKYQDLQQSYSKQTTSVTKMKQKIAELQASIKVLKSSPSPLPPSTFDHNNPRNQPHFHGGSHHVSNPDSFDAFLFTSASTSMIYGKDQMSFHPQTALGSTTESSSMPDVSQDLPLFEDLLPPMS